MPVDTQHPEYQKRLPQWTKCRDVAAGEDEVKAKGTKYLPALPGHKPVNPYDAQPSDYKEFLQRAMLYEATGRTVEGFVGLVRRKEAAVTAPDSMSEILEDIDRAGTPLPWFIDDVLNEVVTVGRAGMLVDYPPADNVEYLADVDRERLRPYVTTYRAEDVINWKTGIVQGTTQLTMVVILQSYEKEDQKDDFGGESQTEYLVLRLRDGQYVQQVYRKIQDDWVIHSERIPTMKGAPLSVIPFVFVGPAGKGWKPVKPPILPVANANLHHYVTSAALRNGLYWAGSPTPYFIGSFHSDDGSEVTEVKLGASSGIHMSEGSELGFLEFTGQGLEPVEKELERIELKMAALGGRILAQDRKMVEAAETAAIHRAGESASLASIARSVSRAITRVLEWIRDWHGVSGEVSVELNTDFLPATLNPQMVTSLLQALQLGRIGASDFVHALQQGEILREDRTAEDIADEVAMTPPSMTGGGFVSDDE